LEIKRDRESDETNQLIFTLSQPTMFTKFLFALEGRILRHQDEFYIFCSVYDRSLFASEEFRKELYER